MSTAEKSPREIFEEHNVVEMRQTGEHVVSPHPFDASSEKHCQCEVCKSVYEEVVEEKKRKSSDAFDAELAALRVKHGK